MTYDKLKRFEVGSRVKVMENCPNDYYVSGEYGTVIVNDGRKLGVQFDNSGINRHNCYGGKDHHCRWVDEIIDYLELTMAMGSLDQILGLY